MISDLLKPKSKEEINKKLAKLSKDDLNMLLFKASYFSYELIVKELLKHGGVNVNYEYNGYIGLHLAADRGFYGICKMLIDAGADVNKISDYGGTPLHHAKYNNKHDVVKLLKHHEIKQ